MTINYLTNFDRSSNVISKISELDTLFNNKNITLNTNIYALANTLFAQEICSLQKVSGQNSLENCELIILSEPMNDEQDYTDIIKFKNEYEICMEESIKRNIPIVHIISNIKWYAYFEEIIKNNNIKLYVSESIQEKLMLPKSSFISIKEFIDLNSLINYSNDINEKILLDLTMAHEKDYHYKLNLKELLKKVSKFSSIDILINNKSFIPEIIDEKINIYKEREYNWNNFKNITYIYYHSNNPYSMQDVKNVLFYALNSKVLYTNYNYYINNLLPSVIMNVSKSGYNIELLPEKEAWDIINENRNTVLFNNTSINILNDLSNIFLSKQYIEPYSLSNTLPGFNEDMYMKVDSTLNKIDINIETFKYDLEKTMILPIIFLGNSSVEYGNNSVFYNDNLKNIKIPFYIENKNLESNNKQILSLIVPIHNNGRYLKYKCFNSILKLTCLEEIEIIFIDDGSTDNDTIRIIKDLRNDYPGIVYKRFENGSGSASRPRNVGMEMARGKYISFLDPDNEAIEDGYTVLLNELKADEELDIVVGNIVREDNVKRNDISYYNKIMKFRENPYIKNMKKLLLDTNLSVQSIQALIVKKDIITTNKISMIEGAAGQDTLFFQELLLKCNMLKVIDKNVHSYYAYVEGSVTNTVTHKFFEKFYMVEMERKRFLEKENLIDFYMENRFNSYIKNWYFNKLNQINSNEEKKLAEEIILKIFSIYIEYNSYFNDETNYIKNKMSK